jgi:hypothetical protein
MFSSFLELSCGKNPHVPCQSAGHDADCGQDLNHLVIVPAFVAIGLPHGGYLQSARRFVLCLTLPNGDEQCHLTKKKEKFEKESATHIGGRFLH